MDPDLVRQQEEAERESLLLLQAPALPPLPPFRSESTIAAVEQLRSSLETVSAREPVRPLRPMPSKTASIAMALGRFVQAAIAGAILGGGMGILAAAMFGLAPATAQIAIFAPAIVFALACGGVSLKGAAVPKTA